ncbi:MAG: hypothetical protein ACREQ7_04020 [Candidatus Binatia bacterium]
MKTMWILAGAISCLAFSFQPVWGKCAPLIKEGRAQLADAKLSKSDEAKVKGLLDEADQLREAGKHRDGVKKANEALNILKKK